MLACWFNLISHDINTDMLTSKLLSSLFPPRNQNAVNTKQSWNEADILRITDIDSTQITSVFLKYKYQCKNIYKVKFVFYFHENELNNMNGPLYNVYLTTPWLDDSYWHKKLDELMNSSIFTYADNLFRSLMKMKKAVTANLKVKPLLLPIQSYVHKSALTHA